MRVNFEADPNRWFEVFDRVRPRPGYLVDFVYFFWGNGGRPLLYLRKARAKRLASCDDYWKRFGGNRASPVAWDNQALLKNLGFEPSALGFLQLVIYLREAPRFHVRWHDQADDHEFVFTRQRLEAMIGQLTGEWMELEKYLEQYRDNPDVVRTAVASSFGAALEMAREGVVELSQAEPFAPIYMRKREAGAEWQRVG